MFMIDFEKNLNNLYTKKTTIDFRLFYVHLSFCRCIFSFFPQFLFSYFALKVHEYETLVHCLIDFQLKGKTKLCS